MAGARAAAREAAVIPETPETASRPRDGRVVTVDALAAYPDRVDVRTPSEFVEDHIPGAENHSVLDDAERARIGTMYAKVSSFAAKRAGAALVARNIAAMLEGPFAAKPRDWAPVVYCWRGGQRSRSLTHMLNEIGWRAVQLDGGYRAWRRHVIAQLETRPRQLSFEVVCGLTGSGKSRLLDALAAEGMQVLDLEALAKHRGSLLGDLPGEPQPSQKNFESQLATALTRFDPRRPVYVESESKRIGTIQLPDSLLNTIRSAPCIRLDTSLPLRIELLKDEYAHYLADAEALSARLAHLVPLHGKKTIGRWVAAAAAGDWDALVAELLARHYDPTYERAIERNFPRGRDALVVAPAGLDDAAFRALARSLDRAVRERVPAEPGVTA
jgi:tRNA 2-selenouridine synthase